MARPKVVKAFGGEVVIRNLPKDKQDLIAEYIEALEKLPEQSTVLSMDGPTVLSSEETIKAVEEAVAEARQELNDLIVNKPLDSLALGIHKDNSGSYRLVDVKYNIETKQAFVDSVKEIGKQREIAHSEFRVKAAQKLMV